MICCCMTIFVTTEFAKGWRFTGFTKAIYTINFRFDLAELIDMQSAKMFVCFLRPSIFSVQEETIIPTLFIL